MAHTPGRVEVAEWLVGVTRVYEMGVLRRVVTREREHARQGRAE